MTTAQELIDELMDTFHVNDPTPDIVNDSFLPSLSSNPYSLQCLIDWIYNIEEKDRITELDFDKIEQDLKQLKFKYGDKVQGLFYPNWQPMKYIYGYEHKQYDRSIYEKNKENIKHIHKQIFGGTESIIHYILQNKTFLFKLPSPDVDDLQQKLDNIIKKNGDQSFKLNMKQSIYILRLLLFKYEIISVDLLYEDHCTMWYDIESKFRELIATKEIIDKEIESLYLDLLCDIYSISESDQGTKGHNAMINIFCDEVDIENKDGNTSKQNRWYHFSFFDLTGAAWIIDPECISFDMIKKLLSRGIPPLQIKNCRHIRDYEIDKYTKISINDQSKILHQCLKEMLNRKYPSFSDTGTGLITIRSMTIPFIVHDIAVSARNKMKEILNECLTNSVTQDCAQCILDYIYVDWSSLIPEYDEKNMLIKLGKFMNFLFDFNITEMNENDRNSLFDKQFINEEMANYLFNELQGGNIRECIIDDIFIKKDTRDWYNDICSFTFKLLYEFVKVQKIT